MKTKQEIETYWVDKMTNVLKGRTIVNVRYLDDDEMKVMGWYKRPICFQLDNETICIPSRDDEGNDGGSLFYQEDGKDLDVLPVI
jgi:hypothetical protein